MKRDEIALLREILALYERFGERTILSLQEKMSHGQLDDTIGSILHSIQTIKERSGPRASSSTKRQQTKTPVRAHKSSLDDMLTALRDSNRLQDRQLAEFGREARAEPTAYPRRLLLHFLDRFGLNAELAKDKSRLEIIRLVIEKLRSGDQEEMQRNIEFMRHAVRSTASLDQWSKIIVRE